MAKEVTIRKACIKELQDEGYITWFPAKVKWQETDVFSIWDILAWKDSEMRFIQITSIGNIQARRKKIEKFFKDHDVFMPTEIWGYRDKKDKEGKKWRIIYL
jgi:hypothetical protein